jgi:hypothetical protein
MSLGGMLTTQARKLPAVDFDKLVNPDGGPLDGWIFTG